MFSRYLFRANNPCIWHPSFPAIILCLGGRLTFGNEMTDSEILARLQAIVDLPQGAERAALLHSLATEPVRQRLVSALTEGAERLLDREGPRS